MKIYKTKNEDKNEHAMVQVEDLTKASGNASMHTRTPMRMYSSLLECWHAPAIHIIAHKRRPVESREECFTASLLYLLLLLSLQRFYLGWRPSALRQTSNYQIFIR